MADSKLEGGRLGNRAAKIYRLLVIHRGTPRTDCLWGRNRNFSRSGSWGNSHSDSWWNAPCQVRTTRTWKNRRIEPSSNSSVGNITGKHEELLPKRAQLLAYKCHCSAVDSSYLSLSWLAVYERLSMTFKWQSIHLKATRLECSEAKKQFGQSRSTTLKKKTQNDSLFIFNNSYRW